MKQRIWVAGAVAAMMIASASAVLAQANPAPGAPTPDSTTPGAMNMVMPAPLPMPAAINYKVLLNQPFDYQDLQQAKYAGLSDHKIAVIAKIARETGEPFSQVENSLLNGATYAMLANDYNMGIGSLYDVSNEEQTISDYKQAYTTTGYYAMHHSNDGDMVNDADMAMPNDVMPSAGVSESTTTSVTTVAPADSDSIIGVAERTRSLSTFVRAVNAAGLTTSLEGPGPFTVFAPNNAAFRQLPKGALRSLMANPTELMQVLEYHVIQGQRIDAAAAMSMTSPTSPATMEGGTLNVTTNNGKVMINNATVVRADIPASNGIIHVINQVLMPMGAPAPDAGTTAP